MDAVDVDLGRGQRGIDARRTALARPAIAEAARDGHAVEFRLERIDGDLFAAQRQAAAHPQRTRDHGLRIRTIGQPGEQGAWVVGVDLGLPLEADALGRHSQAAVQPDLRDAGRAKIECLDVPGLAVRLEVGSDALEHGLGERQRLDVDGKPHRERQVHRAGELFRKGLDGDQRTAARRLGQRQDAVEVDLRRGQLAVELRRRAERELGVAAQLGRAIVRAVLEFDLLEHGRAAVALDPAGQAPRLDDQCRCARGRTADRAREREVAFVARHALFDGNRQVGTSAVIGRSIGSTVSRTLTLPSSPTRLGREAIGIMLTADDKRALALGGPGERAHVALEFELLEHEPRSARRVRQDGAAILDAELLDR